MKLLNKLFTTTTLLAGLITTPLLEAYGVSGAVLKNEKTGHIVRLVGDVHVEKYDKQFSQDFVQQFINYLKSPHQPIAYSESIANLQSLSGITLLQALLDKINKKNIILRRMHLINSLSINKQNFWQRWFKTQEKPKFLKNIKNFSYYDLRTGTASQLLSDIMHRTTIWHLTEKYQNEGLFSHNGTLTPQLLKALTNTTDEEDQAILQDSKNQAEVFKILFNLRRSCKEIKIRDILHNLSFSNALKQSVFSPMLKKYETIIKDAIKPLQSIIGINSKTQLSSTELIKLYIVLINDIADYGFLGKIAQVAQHNQEILIYAGRAHTNNLEARLIELGYKCLYTTTIDSDTRALNKQECEKILFTGSQKIPSKKTIVLNDGIVYQSKM